MSDEDNEWQSIVSEMVAGLPNPCPDCGQTGWHRCPGPATPEPTEETP